MSVLFYVQHLLGIGHLKRAATLARAIAAEGLPVTLISGGEPISVLDTSGFEFVQLPPLRAEDRTFSALVDSDGRPADARLLAARQAALLQAFDRVHPAVVVVELFPFGRRMLRGEIEALLEQAQSSIRLCSVRDILVEKNRPEREAEMVAAARHWFNGVLVHSDPSFAPFDLTFPRASEISDLIHYTGYVVEPTRVASTAGRGEVVVSSGGGRLGKELLAAAHAARALTKYRDSPWTFLDGPMRSDFTTLLANCTLSISQGGYNTVVEILATGARAVLVPYGGGNETEQTLRARILAEKGRIAMLPEDQLTPERLARLIDTAPAPSDIGIDLDGAAATARYVKAAFEKKARI